MRKKTRIVWKARRKTYWRTFYEHELSSASREEGTFMLDVGELTVMFVVTERLKGTEDMNAVRVKVAAENLLTRDQVEAELAGDRRWERASRTRT